MVSREDAKPGTGTGEEQAARSSADADAAPILDDDEKVVLDILLGCTTGRTIAQLAAASGIPRERVAAALVDLRAKGLVSRFNTLVESYSARFPGLELR